MEYGTHIVENTGKERSTSTRKQATRAFICALGALAVVACVLVAHQFSGRIASEQDLENQAVVMVQYDGSSQSVIKPGTANRLADQDFVDKVYKRVDDAKKLYRDLHKADSSKNSDSSKTAPKSPAPEKPAPKKL